MYQASKVGEHTVPAAETTHFILHFHSTREVSFILFPTPIRCAPAYATLLSSTCLSTVQKLIRRFYLKELYKHAQKGSIRIHLVEKIVRPENGHPTLWRRSAWIYGLPFPRKRLLPPDSCLLNAWHGALKETSKSISLISRRRPGPQLLHCEPLATKVNS